MIRIIFLIVFAYVFLIFFVTRLVIPHMGFTKDPLQRKIPDDIKKDISKLKKKSKTKMSFLRNTYTFLSERHCGGHLSTLTKLNYCFIKDLDVLWREKGYLPCTIHNYLLRVFLVKSGIFKENEIKLKHTFCDFNIHQYVKVNVGNKWIDVDIWGQKYGVPFGKHAWLIR